MNCDQAFDEMTAPTDTRGSELQAHLGSCPRCAAMFDVLQPARLAFEDLSRAVDDPPVASPRAKPWLSGEVLQMAERATRQLETRRTAHANSIARGWWVCVAVLIVGVWGLLLGLRELDRPALSAIGLRPDAEQCTLPLHRQQLQEAANTRAAELSCIACHLVQR